MLFVSSHAPWRHSSSRSWLLSGLGVVPICWHSRQPTGRSVGLACPAFHFAPSASCGCARLCVHVRRTTRFGRRSRYGAGVELMHYFSVVRHGIRRRRFWGPPGLYYSGSERSPDDWRPGVVRPDIRLGDGIERRVGRVWLFTERIQPFSQASASLALMRSRWAFAF